MIYSQTFFPVLGSTSISDPSFLGTTIFGVKRNGLGYTKVAGVPTGRQFNLVGSTINFDEPFLTGETVFVIYDNQSSVVPPDCVIPGLGIGTVDILSAIEGQAYIFSKDITGTAPFVLANVVKPAWMTITVVGSVLEFTGTPAAPDVGTGIVVSFDIQNCYATDFVFVGSINVLAAAGQGDLIVYNTLDLNNVRDVFPSFYTVITVGFPVGPLETLTGFLTTSVNAPIGVYVTTSTGGAIELYKNGVLAETIFYAITGIYYFTLLTFAVTDDMEIRLV